jgi:hypothetical protein
MRLPQEVLSSIFMESLPVGYSSKSYYERLRTLCLVSRGFNTLIENDPSFWAQFHAEMSGEALTKLLTKSKGCLLDLKVSQDLGCTPEFVEQILPHARRWRSLFLEFDKYDHQHPKGPKSLLEVPLQNLEVIHINSDPPIVLANFLAGTAPRLIDVRLRAVSIPWHESLLSGLQKLVLIDITWNAPSVERLVEILASSPALEEFSLIDSHISCSTSAELNVSMSALSHVTISNLDSKAFEYLITSINLSHCKRAQLSFNTLVHAAAPRNRPNIVPIPHWALQSLFCSPGATPISVAIGSGVIVFDHALDRPYSPSFRGNNLTPNEINFYLADVRLQSHSLSLFLRAGMSLDVLPVLMTMKNITSLEFNDWSMAVAILEVLSSRPKARGHVPFPNLKALSMSFGEKLVNDVLESVTGYSRYKEAGPIIRGADGISRRLSQFTHVDVTRVKNLTKDTFSQLQDVFGPGVLKGPKWRW